MDGFISQIQRLTTPDGQDARTIVFAVGCPMKCLWCCNPELIGDAAKFLYHPRRCVGCGSCVAQSSGGTICSFDAYAQIGEIVSEKELAARLLEDKQRYEHLGSSVTYSGGDAGMQPEFFREVTRLLKEADVHVALETSGYFPWEKLEPLVRTVDLIIYDIKMLSRHLHKRYTGVDNQLILENAVRIADMGKDMLCRAILIPGVNDSDDEISGRLRFIKNLDSERRREVRPRPSAIRVEIIRYRRLDTEKYASLGMIELMEGTPNCGDEQYNRAVDIARNIWIG